MPTFTSREPEDGDAEMQKTALTCLPTATPAMSILAKETRTFASKKMKEQSWAMQRSVLPHPGMPRQEGLEQVHLRRELS